MKAMKAKKVGRKSLVFAGTRVKTTGGLKKQDLTMNKRGKVVSKDAREREESLLPHQGLACGGHQSQAGTRGQWFYCHWRQEAGGQGALCQGQGNPRGEVEAMNRDLAVGAAGLCRDSGVVVLPRPGCPSCTFTFEKKKK